MKKLIIKMPGEVDHCFADEIREEVDRKIQMEDVELVEFDLNLLQAMKTAPQTANYNRGAYNAGNTYSAGYNGFDAKQ